MPQPAGRGTIGQRPITQCPLLAQSGHDDLLNQCLLSG